MSETPSQRKARKAVYQAKKTAANREAAYSEIYTAGRGITKTSMPLALWAEFLKVDVKTLNNRVKRCGISALLTEKGFRERQRLEKNRAQKKRRKK